MLYLSLVFIGVWGALCSVGLMGLWLGMELSFFGLIPYFVGESVEETDSCMKYYVSQVIGTMVFVVGVVNEVGGFFVGMNSFLIISGMMIKVGLFPFHFWVPIVLSKFSWISCFYVSVIQKIAPIWFLYNMGVGSVELGFLEVSSIITSFVGCLGGLGILQYRVLLGYSSLVHLGWMTVVSLVSFEYFLWYLFLYSIILGGFMFTLYSLGVYGFMDLLKTSSSRDSFLSVWVSLYALSLAGLPPLSGCFLKVLFFYSCWDYFPLGSCFLVISVMISLYFYLCMYFELLLYKGNSGGFFSFSGFSGVGLIGGLSALLNLVLGYPMFMSVGSLLF